jgi:ribonuclease HII
VDEVGRGPLAGPVVAAAVHLGPDPLPAALRGLNDSKKLSARVREAFVRELPQFGAAIGVGIISAQRVDEINILQATREAMHLAVERASQKFGHTPGVLLVDGHLPLPRYAGTQYPLIKGDGRSLAIAAASVVAKVVRDRLMAIYSECYPEYGFAQHKGYGTKAHRTALVEHGPCALHRQSFRWKAP